MATIAVASEDLAALTTLLADYHLQGQTYTYIALTLNRMLTVELGYTVSDANAIVEALEDNYTQSILDTRYNVRLVAACEQPLLWPIRHKLVTY